MDIQVRERSIITIVYDVMIDGVKMPSGLQELLIEMEEYYVGLEPSPGRNWLVENGVIVPYQNGFFAAGPQFSDFKKAVLAAIDRAQNI